MRLPSIRIALALTLLAGPLAAQQGGTPSGRPLPAALAPPAAERTVASPRVAADPVELGLLTGMLVGMTVGGTYGYVTYDDRCGRPEDECMLAREVETGLFGIVGGALGSVIGAGTMYLLDRRDHGRDAAPIRLAPAAGGAMRVEMTLRH